MSISNLIDKFGLAQADNYIGGSVGEAIAEMAATTDFSAEGLKEIYTLADLDTPADGNFTAGDAAWNQDDGNLIAQSASFTQTLDGIQTQRSIDSVELENNLFCREFTTLVAPTDETKALLQMQGSGRARDLAEAVSQSTALADSLTAFSSATTQDALRSLIDDLLTQWAQSSDRWQSLETTLDGNVKISGLPRDMDMQSQEDQFNSTVHGALK